MASPDRVLVIIPAYNEEEALGPVLDELTKAQSQGLVDRPLDVVVIDDGSADKTSQVASAHGVSVLTLPYNLGIGGALRTGFRYAHRNGYTQAIQFDADGQHRRDQIQHLLDGLDAGADLVIGSRFRAADGTYDVSAVRGGAMGILRLLVRSLTGRAFTDTSSGFRGFSADMLEYFAGRYPAEYMESVEALLMAARSGFVVEEVPVEMSEREGGVPSNRSFRLAYHFGRLLLVATVSQIGSAKQRKIRAETHRAADRDVDTPIEVAR